MHLRLESWDAKKIDRVAMSPPKGDQSILNIIYEEAAGYTSACSFQKKPPRQLIVILLFSRKTKI